MRITFQFTGYFMNFVPQDQTSFDNTMRDINNNDIKWLRLGEALVNKDNILYVEFKDK